MQLSELKLISASNIIRLRTGANMTQAELGEKLNYSDKTISKWERGEAIPDAYVLTQMAGIFGVTVDYILSDHDGWKAEEEEQEADLAYSINVIIALVLVCIWTAAFAAFVALWIFDVIVWGIFAIALPVSILTYLILICAFKQTEYLQYVIALLVLSIFVILYIVVPRTNPWQLFLLAVPAEAIVFLSCNIRRRPVFLRKKKKSPQSRENSKSE